MQSSHPFIFFISIKVLPGHLFWVFISQVFFWSRLVCWFWRFLFLFFNMITKVIEGYCKKINTQKTSELHDVESVSSPHTPPERAPGLCQPRFGKFSLGWLLCSDELVSVLILSKVRLGPSTPYIDAPFFPLPHLGPSSTSMCMKCLMGHGLCGGSDERLGCFSEKSRWYGHVTSKPIGPGNLFSSCSLLNVLAVRFLTLAPE